MVCHSGPRMQPAEGHAKQGQQIEIIDSHCHIDDDAYAADRCAVLQRARDAGVSAMLVPATEASRWPALQALCEAQGELYAAYGLHPMMLAQHQDKHLQMLEQILDQAPAIAVGECGLDGHVPGLDMQRQQELFHAQLDIAHARGLPVIVHARRAVDLVHAAFRARPGLRGVIHSFSGSEQQARQLLSLELYLGVGGPVTYPRARRLRAIIAAMPQEQLLLETDAPFQPLQGQQGQRNEPAQLRRVLDTVAELRQCEPAQLAEISTANTRRLFALS